MAFQAFNFGQQLGLIGNEKEAKSIRIAGDISELGGRDLQWNRSISPVTENQFKQSDAQNLGSYYEPPVVGDSIEIMFEGTNEETGQAISEASIALMRGDGSVQVVVRDVISSKPLFNVEYELTSHETGWLPLIANPELLRGNIDGVLIPRSMPLIGFAFAGWSAFTASRIVKSKIERYSGQSLDRSGPISEKILWSQGNIVQDVGTQDSDIWGSSYGVKGDKEKGAKMLADDEDCCIPHDMDCTSVTSIVRYAVPLPWCKPITVDIQSCCREHDIKMWCGINLNKNEVLELLTLKIHRFALEISLELGACILSKFLDSVTKNSIWCGGALVAVPFAAFFGAITGAIYASATFIVQMSLIGSPYVNYYGEKKKCCLCGGTETSRCCKGVIDQYCFDKNGDRRDLCSSTGNSTDCYTCRYGCVYRPSGSFAYETTDKDSELPCCHGTPQRVACPRNKPILSKTDLNRLISEGKIIVDKNGYTTIYDRSTLAKGGVGVIGGLL